MGPKRQGNKKNKPSSPSSSPSSSSATSPYDDTANNNEDSVFVNNTESSSTLEYIVGQIHLLRSELSNKMESTKDQIIKELKAENEILKTNLKIQNHKIINLEKDLLNIQQYVRCNNSKTCGIPDEVPTESLEQKIIDIANVINVQVVKSDIDRVPTE